MSRSQQPAEGPPSLQCQSAPEYKHARVAPGTSALVTRVSDAGPLRRLGVGRGRRPKASQGGNRGVVGGPFDEGAYGDFRVADGGRARLRRPRRLVYSSEAAALRCFRWRRCAGARRRPWSQEDWRPRTGVALALRRPAEGGGDRGCAAGCGATVMSCRS
jgi:hypothetical protein